MTRIRDTGKVRSRERVAVLAALNMAFDVLDRDAQQAHLASAQAEMQSLQQEQAAAPAEVSETALAEQQRQQELAEQLVLKLDQALESDARLL